MSCHCVYVVVVLFSASLSVLLCSYAWWWFMILRILVQYYDPAVLVSVVYAHRLCDGLSVAIGLLMTDMYSS